MDIFARGLVTANNILENGELPKLRKTRYASYDSGAGADFEAGKLSLEELRQYAIDNGEPKVISGRQEYYENLINRFI